MEVEFKSDWLVIQIELLKAIHGYEKNGVNDEIGSINYVASGHGDEKKLLRVIIDRKDNISKANTDTIRTTIEFWRTKTMIKRLSCPRSLLKARRV